LPPSIAIAIAIFFASIANNPDEKAGQCWMQN